MGPLNTEVFVEPLLFADDKPRPVLKCSAHRSASSQHHTYQGLAGTNVPAANFSNWIVARFDISGTS